MRCIIAAAGEGRRWGNHLGIRKHQAPIDGVPILKRLIDQFQGVGVEPSVLCHPSYPYDYPGARYLTVTPDPNSSIDKVYSSRHLWSTQERTLIVFGDVYFSGAGFSKMLQDPGVWAVYGRIGKSRYNKKLHSLFALSIPATSHRFMDKSCSELRALDLAGKLPSGGRLVYWYQHVTGQPFDGKRLSNMGNFCEISDETDDADKPSQYLMLKRSVRKAHDR